MSKLIELETSMFVPNFKIKNESIDTMRSGKIFDYDEYIEEIQPESVNISLYQTPTIQPAICRSKDILVIENYMKSFLSDTKEMYFIQTVVKKLKSKYQNKESILYQLPIDLMAHIILFITIEDYCFGVLQTSKYFHGTFAPQKSPFIMKNMIKNECLECWLYDSLNADNKYDHLERWEMCGCYAWTNYDRTQIPKNVKDIKIIKNKSVYSTLFLLNFMHKCHYGGISRTVELRQLMLQLISTGGGILGVRYMIYFYCKSFLFNRIQYESDHDIPILYGQQSRNNYNKLNVKRTIEDLLYEIYDDETFFRFTYGLRHIIETNDSYSEQFKYLLNKGGDVQFYNLCSIYGFPGVFNNIKTKYDGIEFDENEIRWKTAQA